MRKKNRRINTRTKSMLICIVTLLIAVSINTVTVSAKKPEKGKAQKKGRCEIIKINIEKENMEEGKAPELEVRYKEYPYIMTFTIKAVKNLSPDKYFAALKEDKLVSDAYTIPTLDDSMVRFNVVFNTPVKYKVNKCKNPGQFIVLLAKDENFKDQPKYSVRTASYKNNEKIGNMEETIGGDTVRIIKDKNGSFLVEAGIFDSEAEANKKIEELKNKKGFNIKLYVEKRNAGDIPKFISE